MQNINKSREKIIALINTKRHIKTLCMYSQGKSPTKLTSKFPEPDIFFKQTSSISYNGEILKAFH